MILHAIGTVYKNDKTMKVTYFLPVKFVYRLFLSHVEKATDCQRDIGTWSTEIA